MDKLRSHRTIDIPEVKWDNPETEGRDSLCQVIRETYRLARKIDDEALSEEIRNNLHVQYCQAKRMARWMVKARKRLKEVGL